MSMNLSEKVDRSIRLIPIASSSLKGILKLNYKWKI